MKVSVYSDNKILPITDNKKQILKEKSNKVLDIISKYYQREDIKDIKFHVKGYNRYEVSGFFISILLKSKEFKDITESISSNLSKIYKREDEFYFFRIGGEVFSDDSTVIEFLYDMTDDEVKKWNEDLVYIEV